MMEAGIKDDSQVFNLPVGKSKYMVKRVHSGMKDDGWRDTKLESVSV